MVFDMDKDLTEDFKDIVSGGKKKKTSVKDFEFSRESAAKLDLGFDETISDKDPIAVGHKRIFGKGKRG